MSPGFSSQPSVLRAMLLASALCALLFAGLSYRVEKTFRNPIAFALTDEKVYVLEKERNTLLELACHAPGQPLEAAQACGIEPDDTDHYYMVRKLYRAPEGIVAQSWMYSLQTREFLGYRFSSYAGATASPRVLLTIIFKNPQQYPEMAYAHDAAGNHYFVHNIRYQFNVWKLPASATDVRIDGNQVPPEVDVMGERNGPLDQWEWITVGPDDSLYISSGSSGKVVHYSPAGERIGEIGSVGFGPEHLLAPDEIFFTAAAHQGPRVLTVASKGNRTWVQFDATGQVLRVFEPLKNGYPFPDVLVGSFHLDANTGGGCSFDLANRSFITFDKSFKAVSTYRIKSPIRTALLAALGLLAALYALRMRALSIAPASIRFPILFKLLVPLVILLVITARFVGNSVHAIMQTEVAAESLRRSESLAHATLSSLSISDLKAIEKPEDREGPIYEKVHSTIARIIDGREVEQTPKWILHKIKDGRYYYGVNIWRGAIFMPCVVPKDRTMFFRALEEKRPQHGQFVDDEGEWFSHLSPVLDENENVIYVLELYRLAEELNRAQQQVSRKINELVAVTILAMVLFVLVISFVITRPLRRLMRGTEMISRGDFGLSIDIHSRDELGDLSRAFNKMVGDLKTYTREIARTAAEKESLAGELRLARQLQREMLPRTFPPLPEAPRVAMFAEMEPAREVGGDYYDFFFVDEDHLGVVVADVSGKGVPAGLFMMRIRAMLRGSAVGNLSPADTLSRINQAIAPENPSAMFVTLFYFICHMRTGRIVYCNAGLNPPFLVDGNRVTTVESGGTEGKGLPIGVMDDAIYTDAYFDLTREETFVVFTDGVTESCNSDNALFGEERLAETLAITPADDPRAVCSGVLNEVRTHQGVAMQADDITILAFKLSEAS
ncbi:MAG: SpoIIE family protein phosphatase [Syntrophobacteraceae bacterium]